MPYHVKVHKCPLILSYLPSPVISFLFYLHYMTPDIETYNNTLPATEQAIVTLLAQEITNGLPAAENKLYHGHPVWFLDGNPIVGYRLQKAGLTLLFWSGQSFDEAALKPEGKFKAAQIRYATLHDINTTDLQRWLTKSQHIQWDYKNLVKRKGVLELLSITT